MDETGIFAPFFATIALTFAVWVYMYFVRIRFLTSDEVSGIDLSIPGELARISPASVSNPSDNLKNLFEMPVLFYALVLYLHATGNVDGVHVACAWLFFAFRAAHSVVHCSFNHVMTRFYLYLASSVALWVMAARAALSL